MKSARSLLDREHSELLEKLQELSGRSDGFGRVFENVLKIFSYHLDREEETVMPLLDYISRRTENRRLIDTLMLQRAWEGFTREYDNMVNEHNQMTKLLNEVEDIYPIEGEDEVSRVIRDLKHHMEIEDELLYPAAFTVKDLLERRKF